MLETVPGSLAEADAALDAAFDAPETPTPAPETPAAPAAEPSGPPRDAQGRFTSPSTAAPEPAQAEPAPTPEAPPEPVVAAPEPEAPAEPDEPVSYRADGQDFTIPGSATGADGWFIPTPQVAETQRLLAAGRAALSGSVRQQLSESGQRVQAALKQAEAAKAESQAVLAHLEGLIERNQLGDWLQNVAQNWPVLKAEARAKGLELQQQAERQELEQFREQQRMASLRPVMEQTLESAVLQYGTPAGLDEQAMSNVFALLHEPRYANLVFVKAPYDDPRAGIRQGELVIDYSVVEGAIRLAASGIRQQQAITKAVEANKAVQQPPKIPPTVGGKGTQAPKPGPAIPKFKTREEADRWFEAGGFMDLDVETPD